MDSDEPTGWPEDGYGGDGETPDLGAPQDDGLSDDAVAFNDAESEPPGVGDEPGAEPSPEAGLDDTGYEAGGYAEDFGGDDLSVEPDAADFEPGDPAPGADPDADPIADDESWQRDPFPEALDMQTPEPVDGMPWSDPATLGDSEGGQLPPATAGAEGSPPASDLYAYDGSEPPAEGADPWETLSRSEDPATSSLARFWAPGE